MKICGEDVLVLVDMQKDFLPGGALAVPQADAVIAPIEKLATRFEHLLLTQDWHPPGHVSFASRHPGKKVFDEVMLQDGPQKLWPDHCVQGAEGAGLIGMQASVRAEMVIRKGFHREIDSYSAFFENDRNTGTGLAGYVIERGFRRAFFAGLAYDFCVGFSALDARRIGLEAVVVRSACRAIDADGSVQEMDRNFREAGVKVIEQLEEA